jgi:hypothetical protein
VLEANHDPRAVTILQTAHNLLQEYAIHITDDALRRSFMENVPAHRAILAAPEEIAGRQHADHGNVFSM